MFVGPLLIGVYSYLIFLLGIFGFFYKNAITSFSIVYIFASLILLLKLKIINISISKAKIGILSKFFLLLIVLQALVNLIGALGPELAFDALWYHLTIPKVFLENHKIFHIQGALLYYSDLPKAVEMIYLSALSFSNEILAKIIHFCFGLLSVIVLFKLSRKFLNQELALLCCLIFYSNLVVGWQSITAYIDLGSTFFEITALYQFILWIDKKKLKYLIYCGILIGFSLSAKISAFNSIGIFLVLIFLSGTYFKTNIGYKIKHLFYFASISILIALPWFIFSYLNTGNPIYPLFENNFSLTYDRNPLSIIKLFLFSSDPINPLYLIFLPIVAFFYKKFDLKSKILLFYSFLALIFWFFISSFGGSRFILPYLPAFSILAVIPITFIKNELFKKYIILLIIIVSMSSIGYRFLANYKYVPVILGVESKNNFLINNLNFSFGDFYDTDGYFKNNIKKEDKVLLYGFHNLYYADFPFIDSSWVKKGDEFNYIALQNMLLPNRFSDWKQVYYNKKTMIKLYTKRGEKWVY